MKDNKRWFGVGIALSVGSITKYILNSIGGITSLPYWEQIFITALLTIILLLIFMKERKKLNNIEYRIVKVIVIFCVIFSVLCIILAVVKNKFIMYWSKCKPVFEAIVITLCIGIIVYMVVVSIKIIKKQK